MKRPVRRGFVVLLPYALAVAIVYGMVASALAVPLGLRGSAASVAALADCRADTGTEYAEGAPIAPASATARDEGRAAPARGHDAHAGHAQPAAGAPAPTPPADGDRHPSPDHFDCCSARLGTVGTPAIALALLRRLEVAPRRVRAPRPRMPSRPRPWRVSLGRQPPARPVAAALGA